MSLRHREPFCDLDGFRQQVNRLMEDAFGRESETEKVSRSSWAPPVDVRETEQALLLEVDLPGVAKDDVDIRMTGDSLTLSGERKPPGAQPSLRAERRFGRFRRSFSLDTESEPESVEATLVDGVLRIVMHKAQPETAKQIAIATE